MDFWNSAPRMGRIARGLLLGAVCLGVVALLSLPFTWLIAVPAGVLAVVALAVSLFAWFRFDARRQRSQESSRFSSNKS